MVLEAVEDVLAKCAYVITNPVASGLVATRGEWPGAISRAEDIENRVLRIKRPRFFFGRSFPEFVEIRLVPPPDSHGMTSDEFRRDLLERVETREAQLREDRHLEGKGFLGRSKILSESPFDTPKGPRVDSESRPLVAAQDREAREAARERIATFIREYRAALKEYRAGNRDVVFPAGTWKMRVLFNVRCEPPSTFA